LDVRVSAVHCFISASSKNIVASVFADFSDWDVLDLPMGSSLPLQCRFWLKEFQLAILQKFVRGEIWIRVVFAVWIESRIGRIYKLKSFDLPKPYVRQATREKPEVGSHDESGV
jgi:hypothetical protein